MGKLSVLEGCVWLPLAVLMVISNQDTGAVWLPRPNMAPKGHDAKLEAPQTNPGLYHESSIFVFTFLFLQIVANLMSHQP